MKNKKNLILIVCFCYIMQSINFSSIMVFAKESKIANAKIWYDIEGETRVGKSFDIIVNVENVVDLYGASLDFKYDPEVLEIQGINKGDIFTDEVKIPINKASNGNASIALTYIGRENDTSKTKGTLVIIKAKAKKSSEISLKTTSYNEQLEVDGKNIRIKLLNSESEKICYEHNEFNIDISNELPTLTEGTYEDNSAGLVYTGNWMNLNNSKYSGGTTKLSETRGNTLEFKFDGTAFEIYGHASDWRGKAKIYIDGTLLEIIDCYSKVEDLSKKLYSKTGLARGIHTVKIEVLGEKSQGSYAAKIAIDKVVISN